VSSIGRIQTAMWLLALGFVVLFGYEVLIGSLAPAEVVGISIAAGVLAILFTIHQVRVYRALHDHSHPDHPELMRGLHVHREKRGF
jgi:tetrahydromethanopterin S-methyltransferase subunit C